VRVGTIAKRVGIPFDEDPSGWSTSINAVIRANAPTVRLPPSTTRARSSRKQGRFSYSNRPVADPEKAARKLIEIANTVEAIQDGRTHIKKINGPFLFEFKGGA
jgi:hypothetical protein